VTFEVRLRPEAERDLSEAAVWYEEQVAGLGHQFLDEVFNALSTVGDAPHRYPVVHGNTRRMLIRKFPFGVYYQIEKSTVIVLAIMHASRDPRLWRRRG